MKISKRIPATNLRDVWPKETDFSDWLVTEDGLELIATDMGIRVEDPQRECRSGDFPCDIVGHVLGDEDHRKVIDWLNDNTPPSISLYLAQIKAYQIGDSPVAPLLDVVCRPNLQIKVQREDISEASKETHLWRKIYWEEILTFIKNKRPPFSVQAASVEGWTNISIGRSNIYMELTLTPKIKCIGCGLRIKVAWKEEAFNQLKSQQAVIEAEIGEPLQWLPDVGPKQAKIMLKASIDPSDPANRDQVKAWMYEKSVAFHRAFHSRVMKLIPPTGASKMDDAEAEDE